MASDTVECEGRAFESLTCEGHGSIERAVGIPGMEPALRPSARDLYMVAEVGESYRVPRTFGNRPLNPWRSKTAS